MSDSILSIHNLSISYTERTSLLRSLRRRPILKDISLELRSGEILALVGESGSGKTTLGNAIVGLVFPDSGEFVFQGKRYDPQTMDSIRKHIQLISQDPLSSLNPRMTMGQMLKEVLQHIGQTVDMEGIIQELLSLVDLPLSVMSKYPHELSGGQRQRASIARALACDPDVLICDEIVSALDISVQATILNVIHNLVRKKGLAILFTTHDLHVVGAIAHRVIVLHRGRIVETGTAAEVLREPSHVYTRSLVGAHPAFQN